MWELAEYSCATRISVFHILSRLTSYHSTPYFEASRIVFCITRGEGRLMLRVWRLLHEGYNSTRKKNSAQLSDKVTNLHMREICTLLCNNAFSSRCAINFYAMWANVFLTNVKFSLQLYSHLKHYTIIFGWLNKIKYQK